MKFTFPQISLIHQDKLIGSISNHSIFCVIQKIFCEKIYHFFLFWQKINEKDDFFSYKFLIDTKTIKIKWKRNFKIIFTIFELWRFLF